MFIFPSFRLFLKNMFLNWFGSNLLTIVSKNYFTFPILYLCLKYICFRYINTVVATRKVPLSAKTIRPRVVMKMDIEVSNFILVSLFVHVLSNAHILTSFFQKCFSLKYVLVAPPSKFLEVCLKSEYMWYWSPVYKFNSERALKRLLSADVEVTSTLPNSDTQKDLLM